MLDRADLEDGRRLEDPDHALRTVYPKQFSILPYYDIIFQNVLGNKMPTTIRDVAKKLNLSITTVSRALDGYDDVAAQTRELVIETADQMGYAPNRAARQLRRQKAETVGFIIPAISRRFSEPFSAEFISGMGEALSSRNFDLLISKAATDEAERNLYQRWVNSHKVDGFILSRMRRYDWRVDYLSKRGVRFVGLGKSHDPVQYPCVRIDAADAYLRLVQHIHGHGFSRFAFLGGPTDLVNQIDRLKWFKSALRKCGLEVERNRIVSTDMTGTGGYESAGALLVSAHPPNAILCINDELAFGAMHAAHEKGLRVGVEIAIAGFEGVRDSRHAEPPLTTLDIPVAEVTRQLVGMLVEDLGDPSSIVQEIVIQPELVIRASTGGCGTPR